MTDIYSSECLCVSPTDRTHWLVLGKNKDIKGLLTLEATAYALLALVKAGAFEEAGPIVRWLNRQGFKGGDYSYTQVQPDRPM